MTANPLAADQSPYSREGEEDFLMERVNLCIKAFESREFSLALLIQLRDGIRDRLEITGKASAFNLTKEIYDEQFSFQWQRMARNAIHDNLRSEQDCRKAWLWLRGRDG